MFHPETTGQGGIKTPGQDLNISKTLSYPDPPVSFLPLSHPNPGTSEVQRRAESAGRGTLPLDSLTQLQPVFDDKILCFWSVAASPRGPPV